MKDHDEDKNIILYIYMYIYIYIYNNIISIYIYCQQENSTLSIIRPAHSRASCTAVVVVLY